MSTQNNFESYRTGPGKYEVGFRWASIIEKAWWSLILHGTGNLVLIISSEHYIAERFSVASREDFRRCGGDCPLRWISAQFRLFVVYNYFSCEALSSNCSVLAWDTNQDTNQHPCAFFLGRRSPRRTWVRFALAQPPRTALAHRSVGPFRYVWNKKGKNIKKKRKNIKKKQIRRCFPLSASKGLTSWRDWSVTANHSTRPRAYLKCVTRGLKAVVGTVDTVG